MKKITITLNIENKIKLASSIEYKAPIQKQILLSGAIESIINSYVYINLFGIKDFKKESVKKFGFSVQSLGIKKAEKLRDAQVEFKKLI